MKLVNNLGLAPNQPWKECYITSWGLTRFKRFRRAGNDGTRVCITVKNCVKTVWKWLGIRLKRV